MIVKKIQNLENKIELQINSLKTKIEKMQEMFNKDLEEIKKSQLKMNNAGGRSQDGGGIGRETTFSPTNSLKEQLNAEQSTQNNF